MPAIWPVSIAQHAARAITESYGSPELWHRLARLAPTVRDHETPLETADYYVRRTLRLTARRRQINVASVGRFLLCTGFAKVSVYP
jgi:hypothetical protein